MNNLINEQCLFKQKSYNSSFKSSKILIVFCFIFFSILIKQTSSTYTNTFIDHKTLLTPKQIITNTLKQIKPKFNPRFNSKTNDNQKQQLNVYDLRDGDVKSARKSANKEQVPQSTYYYTDYKPVVKNLVPMNVFCPETGRTVCKDAKAYPAESILNLILEAKANKFNFSSLFVDESQNSDQPNLPELESTIAKSCQGTNDKPEYPEKEEKPNYNRNSKGTKGNDKYENKNTNYKRPESVSSVYYDNENTYSTHNTLPNQHNNYQNNNYDQQRIINSDNTYDKNLDQISQAKQYDSNDQLGDNKPVDQQVNRLNQLNQINYPQPIDQQQYKQPTTQRLSNHNQQLYQQPQSSIKFEQQFNQPNRHQQMRTSKSMQTLSYGNQNGNYFNSPKNQPTRPYQTKVTIIPFIQYITQLPTSDYHISTDKQLIDTITQSLQKNPLAYTSPDAWLPIKAYTTDLQRKEIDEHLANDRIGSDEEYTGSDELTPEYTTTNYRDKRSTCTTEDDKKEDKNKKNKKNSNNKKEGSEDSVTRVKKQAGFDEEPEELCQTRRLFITPKAGFSDKSEWRYIVNVGERDSRLKQVIKVDVCATPNGPCSNQISLPFGYVSKCKQKYIKKKLLAIDPDGQSTSTENFFIPSCCVCEINRVNQNK